MIQLSQRHRTVPVKVGGVTVGGGAPVVKGTKIIANKWLRQERYG